MSEIAQSVKKTDSQLPAINNKQQNGSINNEMSRSDDQGNDFPLTHANKRKKHRKKLRKHSPEYYQQKKVQKVNKKMEQKWDSHFINDQIPELYIKRKKSKPGKTLSKLTSEKRSITPLNPKTIGHTTGNFIVKKESLPLPKIQKPSKRSNSFNVHLVPQKPVILTEKAQKLPQTVNQRKPPSQQNEKRKRTSQISRRPAKLQKPKQKPYLQDYRKTLNDLHEQIKFTNCHKEALQLFLLAIDKKSVRDLLDKEFNLIRKKQSLVFKVNNAIINRQKLLDKVNQTGVKLVNDEKQTLELVDHYRTSTLAVVEEILKWKETWHALYYEVFKKSKNFDFVYQTQNYLFTLISSTDNVLQKISKQKQSKVQNKKEKTQIAEQMSPKKQQKPDQKLNKSQEIQKLPIENVQVQKQTLNPTNQEIKPKQPQIIVPSTNIETPKNEIPEQSPIKQLQQDTQRLQKPTIKAYTQKSTYIATQNDPFLISLHSIAKEDKNIILKIRACQLLLIEESFNFLKK